MCAVKEKEESGWLPDFGPDLSGGWMAFPLTKANIQGLSHNKCLIVTEHINQYWGSGWNFVWIKQFWWKQRLKLLPLGRSELYMLVLISFGWVGGDGSSITISLGNASDAVTMGTCIHRAGFWYGEGNGWSLRGLKITPYEARALWLWRSSQLWDQRLSQIR